MKIHALRLAPGDDLKAAIDGFVAKHGKGAGTLVSCVGSLDRAAVRFANAAEAVSRDGKFEILSLSGTLGPEGSHLHICLAAADGSLFGGHLMVGCAVFTTAEILPGEIPGFQFLRRKDERTGYKELLIKKTDG